jgi:hypothetical protein
LRDRLARTPAKKVHQRLRFGGLRRHHEYAGCQDASQRRKVSSHLESHRNPV